MHLGDVAIAVAPSGQVWMADKATGRIVIANNHVPANMVVLAGDGPASATSTIKRNFDRLGRDHNPENRPSHEPQGRPLARAKKSICFNRRQRHDLRSK